MPKIDHAAVAVYAAGIADALACIESDDAGERARFESVTDKYGGHVGIMEQVAEAAEIMERFRVRHGEAARWGGELPYLYDVWDAIAQALWTKLGGASSDQWVESAIQTVMSSRPSGLTPVMVQNPDGVACDSGDDSDNDD